MQEQIGNSAGNVGERPHLTHAALLLLQRAEVLGYQVQLNDDRGGLRHGKGIKGESGGGGFRQEARLDTSPEIQGERCPPEIGHNLSLNIQHIDPVDTTGVWWGHISCHAFFDLRHHLASQVDVADCPTKLIGGESVPGQEDQGLCSSDSLVYPRGYVGVYGVVFAGLLMTSTVLELCFGPLQQVTATTNTYFVSKDEASLGEHSSYKNLVAGAIADLPKK